MKMVTWSTNRFTVVGKLTIRRGDYPDNIIRDYFQFNSLRLSGTDIGDQAILDLCDDRNYGSIAGVVSYYFVCDRCGQ